MEIFFKERPLGGFSLVEVVVVIGITAILMAMSLGYNRDSERQIILFSEQAKVAGIFERAKTLALTRYKEGSADFCGFGVYFDTGNVFKIFGDDKCDGYSAGGGDAVVESQSLDGRLRIEIATGIEIVTDGSVIFKPPYGEVVLGDSLTSKSFPVDIVLKDRKTGGGMAIVEVGAGGGVTMK